MANVSLRRADTSQIEATVNAIATQATRSPGSRLNNFASYPLGERGFRSVFGSGFTYDASGRLTGGTISSFRIRADETASDFSPNNYTVDISEFSLPAQQVIALASAPGGAAPVVLGGGNTVRVEHDSATLYGGDDTITVVGNGSVPPSSATIRINGGGGADTVVLPALRDQSTITGGRGTQAVSTAQSSASPALSLDLIAVDGLRFLDGSVYQNAETSGAQAALVFLGILGRLPDTINAGGYDLLSRQSGLQAAADRLLATPEGHAVTGSLDTAGFISRLYGNVLRRAPNAAEAAERQGALDAGRVTRAEVAAAVATLPEARDVNNAAFAAGSVFGASPNAVAVQRVYTTVLNRPAEASAFIPLLQNLESRATTIEVLQNTAVTSPELRGLLGGATDNASFVNFLQRNVYGAVDQATTELWSNLLDRERVTRSFVADAFANSFGADAKIAPLLTNQGVAHL